MVGVKLVHFITYNSKKYTKYQTQLLLMRYVLKFQIRIVSETACISIILQAFQGEVSKYKIVCFVLFLIFFVKFISFIF